jgi:hypothetical protein
MPQSFRKSLTAWEALAALPPTPRMKRRPARARSVDEEADDRVDGVAIELGDDLGGFGEVTVGKGHRAPESDSNSGRAPKRKACGLLACVRMTAGAAIVSALAIGAVEFDPDCPRSTIGEIQGT